MGFFTFEAGLPRRVRYRMEPKPKDSSDSLVPAAEALALAEEYGWEFVDDYGSFYIFRALRPDAREMNTDCAVQALGLKNIKRQFLTQVLLQVLLIGNAFTNALSQPFRFLVTFGPMYTFGLAALLAAILLSDIIRVIHIRKLQTQLKANIPLDHGKPWRRGALFHRVSKAASLLLAVCVMGLLLSRCTAALTAAGTAVENYPGDPPVVTISDLSPSGTYTQRSFLASSNTYTEISSGFAPTILEWKEYGELTTPEEDVISGFISVTYYETTSPALAAGLFQDYLREAKRSDRYKEFAIPQLKTDRYATYIDVVPTVLIQHGPVFISASISLDSTADENMLAQWAKLMADGLA